MFANARHVAPAPIAVRNRRLVNLVSIIERSTIEILLQSAMQVKSRIDTVGLFFSDTAYSPGGSPKQPSGEHSHVDASTIYRSRPPRYRPCRQVSLPQRKPLHADGRSTWHLPPLPFVSSALPNFERFYSGLQDHEAKSPALTLPSYLSCPPLAGAVEAKCNRCRSDSQRDRRSSTECLSGSVFGPHGDVGVGALHHHGRLESVSGNRA